MPRSEYSDDRYEATREDVLRAVGRSAPNPLSGPEDPDPFGVNEHPHTDFTIASMIAYNRGLPLPMGHVGRALKRNRLRELLKEMVAAGELVGRTRKEWYEMGREYPSRSKDVLYAHPELARAWDVADGRSTQTKGG